MSLLKQRSYQAAVLIAGFSLSIFAASALADEFVSPANPDPNFVGIGKDGALSWDARGEVLRVLSMTAFKSVYLGFDPATKRSYLDLGSPWHDYYSYGKGSGLAHVNVLPRNLAKPRELAGINEIYVGGAEVDPTQGSNVVQTSGLADPNFSGAGQSRLFVWNADASGQPNIAVKNAGQARYLGYDPGTKTSYFSFESGLPGIYSYRPQSGIVRIDALPKGLPKQ